MGAKAKLMAHMMRACARHHECKVMPEKHDAGGSQGLVQNLVGINCGPVNGIKCGVLLLNPEKVELVLRRSLKDTKNKRLIKGGVAAGGKGLDWIPSLPKVDPLWQPPPDGKSLAPDIVYSEMEGGRASTDGIPCNARQRPRGPHRNFGDG